jgi:hypothetical protein
VTAPAPVRSQAILPRPRGATVSLCVDSSERDRCGPGPSNGISVTRTFEGRPVVITFFGVAAAESAAKWQVVALTTDPAETSLFERS